MSGGGGGGKGVGGGGASSAEMGEAAAPPPGLGKGNDGGVQEKVEALVAQAVFKAEALVANNYWWNGKKYRKWRHLTDLPKPWWADIYQPWRLF